jgi:ribosome biogenesis GTPase / thiamine phosphate phosphatase
VNDRLASLGWSDRWEALRADGAQPGWEPARVLRHDGSALLLATAEDTVQVPLSPALDPAPVVGDWVLHDGDTIRQVLPRSGLLRRRSAHGDSEQSVAANVDVVLIVCGADRPAKSGRVQRFATLAWDAGAVPVLVLSKADLADDPSAVVDELLSGQGGLEAVVTSAFTGTGLDRLHEIVRDRTVVAVGESGAGKSRLVNALVGAEVAAVGEVRAGDHKGRHTTTARQLHVLPGGGWLIDTPGVRAIGLWIDPDAVTETFDDVEALAPGCKFSDCRHAGEPGCAVAAAVDAGQLDPARVEAWHRLEDEAASAALRADEPARRRHEKRFARITKDAQKHKTRPDESS